MTIDSLAEANVASYFPGQVPCPSCMDSGRLSERDGLFKTYEDSVEARACIMCKGDGRVLKEPHEVIE